jgi:hypothetical protein
MAVPERSHHHHSSSSDDATESSGSLREGRAAAAVDEARGGEATRRRDFGAIIESVDGRSRRTAMAADTDELVMDEAIVVALSLARSFAFSSHVRIAWACDASYPTRADRVWVRSHL